MLLTTVFPLIVVGDMPIEVLSYIMLLALGRHDTMTYRAINLTSKQFQHVASTLPDRRLFQRHILFLIWPMTGKYYLDETSSTWQLTEMFSKLQEVAVILTTLVDEDVILDSETTVLLLRHKCLGWFHLLDMKQNPKSLMKYCK